MQKLPFALEPIEGVGSFQHVRGFCLGLRTARLLAPLIPEGLVVIFASALYGTGQVRASSTRTELIDYEFRIRFGFCSSNLSWMGRAANYALLP